MDFVDFLNNGRKSNYSKLLVLWNLTLFIYVTIRSKLKIKKKERVN